MSLSLSHRIAWRLGWLFYAFCWVPLFRPRVTGRGNIPWTGPVLLLSNHTSMMDPPHVAWPCIRPVHFMASEQLFRINPMLTWLISGLNAFPKAKGIKDKTAMVEMDRRYNDGGIVNIYPEGERTWDGRLLPIVPSTARMLKRMRARVVYARIRTGHLNHPRWARWPRWVPLEIEYSKPFVYDDPDRPDDEIMAELVENLSIDPTAVRAGWPSLGFRMAEGLPDFLWACPQCFASDSLSVATDNRNAITCGACSARWRVDVSQRLLADGGPATDTHVMTAHDAVTAHFGSPPIADRERFERTQVAIAGAAALWKVTRGVREPEVLGEGEARLTPTTIGVYAPDGTPLWSAPLSEVLAVNLQVGNRFQVRTADGNFQINPAAQSPIRWGHFTRDWWHRATEPRA